MLEAGAGLVSRHTDPASDRAPEPKVLEAGARLVSRHTNPASDRAPEPKELEAGAGLASRHTDPASSEQSPQTENAGSGSGTSVPTH